MGYRKGLAEMSDSKLRNGLIRLAHERPELREHLPGLLGESRVAARGVSVLDAIRTLNRQAAQEILKVLSGEWKIFTSSDPLRMIVFRDREADEWLFVYRSRDYKSWYAEVQDGMKSVIVALKSQPDQGGARMAKAIAFYLGV